MYASSDSDSPPGLFQRCYRSISIKHQSLLDRATPYTSFRWLSILIVAAVYMIRVIIVQGFYIVTYALGIYLLNLFIAFLTPKIDPAFSDYEEDGPSLPTKVNEEFRPFMRRLPEFKFWYSSLKAFLIALFCTLFRALDVPVFWPILVMYFCILFFVTMKKQILHMIKYRYIPFTRGKTRYPGKEDTSAVINTTQQ